MIFIKEAKTNCSDLFEENRYFSRRLDSRINELFDGISGGKIQDAYIGYQNDHADVMEKLENDG